MKVSLAVELLLVVVSSQSSSYSSAFHTITTPVQQQSSISQHRPRKVNSGRNSNRNPIVAATTTKLSAFPIDGIDAAVDYYLSSNTYYQNFASFVMTTPNLHDVITAEQVRNAIVNDLLLTLLDNPWHIAAIALFASGSLLNAFINSSDDYSETPYEPGSNTYDPQKAEIFYSKRPFMVLKRILRLSYLTLAFNAGLLFDWLILGKLFKDEEYTALRKNEPRRAQEALTLCTQLGPTFIKLGQALSIRTDIVPELYALELRQLQDAVPPFDSEKARTVLKKELGVSSLARIFDSLSDKPVASASIGQVYRGKLKDGGRDVAVKVQRLGILGEIALDLHVLRLLTPIQTRLQNSINCRPTVQEDIDQGVSLVDEWGRGLREWEKEKELKIKVQQIRCTRTYGGIPTVRTLSILLISLFIQLSFSFPSSSTPSSATSEYHNIIICCQQK